VRASSSENTSRLSNWGEFLFTAGSDNQLVKAGNGPLLDGPELGESALWVSRKEVGSPGAFTHAPHGRVVHVSLPATRAGAARGRWARRRALALCVPAAFSGCWQLSA
jgi:hypothetical protein